MDQSEASQAQAVEAIYGFAAQQMRGGIAPAQIEKSLVEKGLDAQAAAVVVRNLSKAKTDAVKKMGQKHMLYGALWCIGGTLVTALTYQAAANKGGGSYVVAWGAIVFGAIQFFRGMFQAASGK